MADCIFCKIIEGRQAAHKIWEDMDFLAFLDRNPVNPGHTLVIPKKHADYIFDLQEPLYSGIFKVAKKLAGPIKRVMNCKRVGLGIEGFDVPHVHIHLIPLNKPGEFDPKRARPATKEELAEVAERIRNVIGKL